MPLQKDSEIYRNIEPLIQRQIDAAIAASNGASSLSPSTTAFLRRSGDTITGNIAVSPNVTIDGVDIDVAISALQATVGATKAFAYSGLGLSNTDDGTTYTLVLTSSNNPGANASILATDSAGRFLVEGIGIGSIAASAGTLLRIDQETTGVYTVPILLTTTRNTIVNSTQITQAMKFSSIPVVSAGVTDSGYHAGMYAEVLRTDAADTGTIAGLYGGFFSVGNYGTTSRTTNLTNGFKLQLYAQGGTIVDSRLLWLTQVGSTNPTSSNYGIYADTVAMNHYFAGDVRIGSGASGAKLYVTSTTAQARFAYNSTNHVTHTVSSTGNVTIDATGGNIYTPDHVAHPSYVSQLTNWRISNAGEADFRYIYTDELHAKAFIADLEQALAGGQIISKSVAKIYADFAAPTAGNTANLDVEEFAGFVGFRVFADGDLIRIRQFDRSGGGLKISDIWGTVVYSAQVAGSNPPAQRYVFTRSGTYPGTGSGTIKAGTLALDYGTSGNGYLEQNAIDGLNGANSPYYQGVTWTSHPKAASPNGLNVKFRLGQLRGLTGNDEYGLYAGTGWTAAPNEGNVSQYTTTAPTANDAHRYIIAGQNGVAIYNADFIVYSGTTPVFYIDRINPFMALGSDATAMGYLSGPAGYWVGNDSGLYKFRLGSVSGGALSQGLSWDGSRLNVIGSINIGPASSANYGVSIGNPLLMLRFDGDATGHKGQVASLTSLPYYDAQGKFGKAVVIADAVTNLVTNGDFETDTAGWSVVGTGATMARITTLGRYNSCSLKLTAGGGGVGYVQNTITSSTTQKTFSCWVIPEASGTTIQIGNTGDGSTGAISIPTGVWTKISYTVTPANATRIWYIQTNAGKTVYIDGVQLESNAVARPFTATSTSQTGIAYSGGNIAASAGTFSAWVCVDNTTVTKTLLSSGTDGAIFVGLTNTNQLQVTRKNIESVASAASGVVAGVYAMITVTWLGVTVKTYVNGALLQTATASTGFAQPSNITIGTYDVGGTLSLNGAIDDVFILDRVLTADEIKALYNSNAPAAIDANPYSLFLYGENNQGYVRGNATGLFGYSDTTGASGTGAFALVTTNSTALGTPFGSVTLNAGDMMLGSASAGSTNLYYDRANGKLRIRVGTTDKIVANSDGALGIKDAGGTNNVILFSGTGASPINQILARVDLYGSGSITAGATFDDVIFDVNGLTLKSTSGYADLNTVKWKYSSAYVGSLYNYVDTGAATTVAGMQAFPYSGGSYSNIYISAYSTNTGSPATQLFLGGIAQSATAGPFARWTFNNTSNVKIGGSVIFCTTGGTSSTLTPTAAVRYRMHYRLVVRASGGNATTLTGDLGVNATTTTTVGGTANDFRVGVHSTGYAYWDRVAGAETYEVTFWAIYI